MVASLASVFSAGCPCGESYAIGAFLALPHVEEGPDLFADAPEPSKHRRRCARCAAVVYAIVPERVALAGRATEQLAMGREDDAQALAMAAYFPAPARKVAP